MKWRKHCLVLVLLSWGSVVWADEVYLKNGDRFTGEVVNMEEGVLKLKTTAAGDIKINWTEIQAITSTKSLNIQTTDESLLKGALTSPSPNQVTVTSPDLGTTAPIPLTLIKAINPAPLVRYNGILNLGGTVTKGNSDTKAFNASALYSLRADRHRFGLEGKYNYGEQTGKITVRNALAQLKYDFFITKHVYWNTFALFEQDTFQDLILRSTLGTGLGYQFIDTKRTQLSAELGIAYVNEDWKTRADDNSPAGRWALNFSTALIPERLIVFHRQEGFYDFNDPNALRIRAEQGLRVPVYKQFALNMEYDVRYNSNPAPGRKKTDHLYIVGVSYELSR